MYNRVPNKLELKIVKWSAYCTINSKADHLTISTLIYWVPYCIFNTCDVLLYNSEVLWYKWSEGPKIHYRNIHPQAEAVDLGLSFLCHQVLHAQLYECKCSVLHVVCIV